jgi:hypothetical protein
MVRVAWLAGAAWPNAKPVADEARDGRLTDNNPATNMAHASNLMVFLQMSDNHGLRLIAGDWQSPDGEITTLSA